MSIKCDIQPKAVSKGLNNVKTWVVLPHEEGSNGEICDVKEYIK